MTHVRHILQLLMLTTVPVGCGGTAVDTSVDAAIDASTGTEGDASLDAPASSACTQTAQEIACRYNTKAFMIDGLTREVHWQVPSRTPPASGFPVVLLFQGSFFSAQRSWQASASDPIGAYFQTEVIKRLLDDGYAVLTPEAKVNGTTFWDTNQPLYANNWDNAPDAKLMGTLFAAIAAGEFGSLDATKLFASGISSGGYMTSRMALSYPGKFRSLAVVSASWATCGGAICVIPSSLPTNHPPTLFLHGMRDAVVPITTAQSYDSKLREAGVVTKFVIDDQAGHEWIAPSAAEIAAFFAAHP